jgi:proline dehydrogenase
LNRLGENVNSREEAQDSRDTYLRMLRELAAAKIDGIIAIKPTQLGLDLDRALCQGYCDQIAESARSLGRIVEMDMEGTAYTDSTLDIYEATARRFPGTGVAVQAYLFRTEKDLERLYPLKPKIRLVKGAYREPPNLAIQEKRDVDSNFKHLTDLLLDGAAEGRCTVAFGTHDPFMLDYAKQGVAARKVSKDKYEFQMLYGIRRDLQEQLYKEGHPMRVYIPFGTEWVPYFMRRLSERPANVWFVFKNLFAEKK